MQVVKSYNNNIVLVKTSAGVEQLAIGLGIGFNKKKGDTIDPHKILQLFTAESSKDVSDLVNVVRSLSTDIILLTKKVLKIAEEKLPDFHVDDRLLLTLTDHINYAIERSKQHIFLRNPLIGEIKSLYPTEYKVGLEIIARIAEETGIEFPHDEAASIALHIVNSSYDTNEMADVYKVVEISRSVFTMIKYHYHIELDESSYHFTRFSTHLKYFILRQISGKKASPMDDNLFEMVKEKYEDAYKCAQRIVEYLEKQEGWKISKEEQFYLTIHIHKLIN